MKGYKLLNTRIHGQLPQSQPGPSAKEQITLQSGIFLLRRVNFQNSIAIKIYSKN